MGEGLLIRTLYGDYSKPSHEGYRNTIELPVGEQYGTSLIRHHPVGVNDSHSTDLGSESQTNTSMDFLIVVDSRDPWTGENIRERTRLRLFQFSLRDQASNWLERLQQDPSPHGRILLPDSLLNSFHREGPQNSVSIPNRLPSTIRASKTLTINQIKKDWYHDLFARSYPTEDPQCSTQTHGSINAITVHTEQQSASYNNREKENKKEEDNPENIYIDPSTPPDPSVTFITEKVLKFNSFFELLRLVPLSSNTELICTKEEDGNVMFIKIIPIDDNFRKEEPEVEGQEVEYFDIFPTRSELAYHKYLMCDPILSIFL
ncbi:hypothetical protein Tco_1291255 [Tanacetum coccineum]